MVKRVTLNGAEVRVDELDGQNTVVKNLSDGTILASPFPSITENADNVVEIPAGSGEVVFNTRGTVYLLGTGKVQCTGTDYSTVNFKMPSSSSGGGGDKPSGEMPVMTGIDVFNLYNPAIYYSSGVERLECPFPLIMYMVFTAKSKEGIQLERSGANGTGMTLSVFQNRLTGSDNAQRIIQSNIDAFDGKFCVAIVSHSDGKFSYYINDACIGTSAGDTRNENSYQGGVMINGYWRNNGAGHDGSAMILYAMAIGHEEHTSEQIIQNSRWLMQKYGIGGG